MKTFTYFNSPILSFQLKIKGLFSLVFLSIFFCNGLHAQTLIENVVVETYYVSDSIDAADTTGGHLELGSKTYRIFVDLAPSVKLKKIYGDANHPLIFNSTDTIFNNSIDGQSFGKDFQKSRLGENTVALDSWLTLSQTTKLLASGKTTFGVLKPNDVDGSFIGGANNDLGLLANNDPLAGIPITVADGNDTITISSVSWVDFGFSNILTDEDSTIFGSIVPGTRFESRNCYLSNSGMMGADSVLNHVLVAQITTKGELSFELNLEVEIQTITGPQTVKLVARDSVLNEGEQISAFLSYPQACGCMDAEYLEYSPSYACNIQDSCKTLLVLGCMDPMACNFDANANFNIQEMCCYVGLCNDLDMSVLCPELKVEEVLLLESSLQVYPNPTQSSVTIKGSFIKGEKYQLEIFDFSGKRIKSIPFTHLNAGSTSVDLSSFPDGIYNLRFVSSQNVQTGRVIKN